MATLDASLLGNLLTGKGTIRAFEGKIRDGEGTILKYKSIIKTTLNLILFIQEIIYLK